jgi:predicted molibdopterin-dependent oxidoreductase YjgC
LLPDALPGHLPVRDAAVRDRLGKLWGVQPPAEPGLSYETMIGGGLQALYVMGANPAADSLRAEALSHLDFLVVQDLFLTETAQLADVVLPATSFAEAEGTYTNLERRVQRGPQGINPAGESRADWQILVALAVKWQTAQTFEVSETSKVSETKAADWKKKKQKAKTGPTARPWNYPTVGTVLDEIGKAVPTYAGIRWETLGEGGQQWNASALAKPARRVEPVEITPIAAPATGNYLLVSGPVLWDGGALMAQGAEQVRKRMVMPFIALNPADLTAAGLVEGPVVTVTSPRASVVLPLRADASVHPGTAWVPAHLTGAPAELLGAGTGEYISVVVS